jgi:outer membrane protein OmpA-like peptidoglycan-associated protein
VRLLFEEGAADLSDAVKRDLGRFAEDLLRRDQQRVQLLAYAKGTADAASRARRLSLTRALAVRTYLMEQGVLPTRIDVRALGNKAEEDPRDRVDVELAQR